MGAGGCNSPRPPDQAYARKLGIRHRQPAIGDAAAIADLRKAIAAVLREPSGGTPLVSKG